MFTTTVALQSITYYYVGSHHSRVVVDTYIRDKIIVYHLVMQQVNK